MACDNETMASRTDFEIRRTDRGFTAHARTSWWRDGASAAPASAGGLARDIPFRTVRTAKLWVSEQFEVPITAWKRGPGLIRAMASRGTGDR